MGYHYIALIAGGAHDAPPRLTVGQSEFLQAQGLQQIALAESIALFVSRDTPTVAVPGGVVIGHIFSRNGQPATPGILQARTSIATLASDLLTQFWGDYLLVRLNIGSATALEVMREPSGGVPCLHSITEGEGFITSDVALAKGLGLHNGEIDWGFVAQALVYPYVNTARTGLTDLHELLPGSTLKLDGASVSIHEAWSPWTFVDRARRHQDVDEAAFGIRAVVAAVVRAWAKTDSAVLMELSGGLDSSIVAMCLRDSDARVTCSTMVTPVPGADERHYAQQVADALGSELHAQMLGFENAHVDFALPVATAKPRMSVLQSVSNDANTIAAQLSGGSSFFSGGGGDSVFCYASGAAPAADAFKELGIRAGMAAIADLSALHTCTYWKAAWLTLRKLQRGTRAPFRAQTSLLNPAMPLPLLERHPWFAAPPGSLPGDQERIADLVGTQVFRDGAPRGSTHWLRLPLLSQPVMEACLKVPSWMWIADGRNRAVARQAFADCLPRDVLERRSKGTFMSYFGAVYERRKQAIRDQLLGGHLQARGLLDGEALEAFLASTRPPRDTSFMRVFDLCMIENWLRHQR